MKKLLSALFLASSVVLIAQPKGKDPKMAATLTPGYYCNLKGDTIKGEVQTNPTNGEVDFYQGFNFKLKTGKVMPISNKKAKAYGFDGRNFTLIPFDAGFVYIEYLAQGRLNFFEYKFAGSVAGKPGIESIYFIQDTKADESSAELRELKQIKEKFYKKDIKPYMKAQIATWENLDKFTFNKEVVGNAIREFNRYYDTSPTQVEVEAEKVTGEEKEVEE
ncbi:MAG: hypothetical protein Q7W45_01430 [Bacteroidota bacterium]|nr:hypothetical protein [Bacteroidota bacterium]MDP3147220.1 hypothetical protein [Bacteroidota bacterium]MDP3557706.1 hypothetical protein [Bacteroidota bacterium]